MYLLDEQIAVRTGCPVLTDLWPYVPHDFKKCNIHVPRCRSQQGAAWSAPLKIQPYETSTRRKSGQYHTPLFVLKHGIQHDLQPGLPPRPVRNHSRRLDLHAFRTATRLRATSGPVRLIYRGYHACDSYTLSSRTFTSDVVYLSLRDIV